MDQKDAYIAQLEGTVKTLQQQVTNLTEMLLLMRKDKFGSSSEKTPKPENSLQLSIFNEAEEQACGDEEPIIKTVSGYKRKNPKTKREEIIKDLPVVEIECELTEEECTCPQCNGKLDVIGKEVVREQLQYIPAQLQIVRTTRKAYGCTKCKRDGNSYVIKAQPPAPVMNHSLASASSVAHVMYQKYVNALPLYRQEKDWEQMGIALSRGTMANWIIKCSKDWFSPVIENFKKKLLEREVLHCDETPVQVLKEPGKSPRSKSHMWVYRTGADTGPPIVIFDYKPSREGQNAVEYLKDFKGYLHTDAFSGYNKLTGVVHCFCWAHVRRYFIEAIQNKLKTVQSTNAEKGRDYCDKLFMIERTLQDCNPEERKRLRLELERPLLDEFWTWIGSLNPTGGSNLLKAVNYAKNHKQNLENYLLDGRCSISNNLVENAIRPFAVGRRNWLFSDTSKGADSSAMVYSIVETAKAYNLNIYTYLSYLLTYMPGLDWKNYPELLEDLMPWSDQSKRSIRWCLIK